MVSYDPIIDFLPLGLSSKIKTGGEDGELSDEKEVAVTFAMDQVANLTIKLDLLGVRCCSVVAEVMALAKLNDDDININDDPIIYDNLQDLKRPHGIFQIEAPTNLRVCQKVKPKNKGELSDVVAIARPGALSFLDTYEKNENVSVHPLVDPILKQSRGVCLYQEQVMAMFNQIGFSLEESEQIRRVIGKKKKDEVQAWKSKIYKMCETQGHPVALADLIWKICDDSAQYQFNKSHSVAYASLSALTTYLKFKYPLFFFLALLKQVNDEPKPLEELAKIHGEMPSFGISLLPPDIFKSKLDFSVEGPNIRYGLSSIKNIADKKVERVVLFQKPFANKFEIFQSATDAGLDIRVFASLIQSGCIDSVDKKGSRPRLTLEAQLWKIFTDKERVIAMKLAEEFNYDLLNLAKELVPRKLIKESRWETIRKKYEPCKEIYHINSKMNELANYFYERTLLGYVHSCRLIDIFKPEAPGLIDILDVQQAEPRERVFFMGIIAEKPYEGVSKKNGGKYVRYTIEDERNKITGILMDNGWSNGKKATDRLKHMAAVNNDKMPKQNSMVMVRGTKGSGGDTIFIDEIFDQNLKIYTKFADVEKLNEEKQGKLL